MANFIIFAAASTIGQAVTKELNEAGHHTFLTARNKSLIEPDYICDLTEFDQVDMAFSAAIEKFGKIDGVVNCAGSLLLKPAHLTTQEQYHQTINASLTTSFAITRSSAKYMIEGGSVIFISSAAALTGLANHDAIAAAKAGIIGLALSSAATYAGQNLRFNVVAPGLTETSLTKSITGNPTSRKYSESMHALGRIGRPEDVSRAVCFLLNPLNHWITGQVLSVDGGLAHIQPKMRASL
jgi:NAD(P)-dependent dehydrogenase (short-subunit alcohol dehydrogenase family)